MSELRVVPFPNEKARATDSLLETLETVAREVRLGEIEAFVLVGVKRNGDVFCAQSEVNGAAHFALLGGLHNAAWELNQDISERAIRTAPPEPDPA